MRVGIVFCGGCNPYYDRGQLAQDLVTTLCDHQFVYNSLDCDLVIYLSGCTSNCAFKHTPTDLPRIYVAGMNIDAQSVERKDLLKTILSKIAQYPIRQ